MMPAELQGRKILVTIFCPNDRKRREPFEIRGTVSYICDLADDGDTVEVEIEATSVTMAAPKDDGDE